MKIAAWFGPRGAGPSRAPSAFALQRPRPARRGVEDLGTLAARRSTTRTTRQVARAVADGEARAGVLVCGTGIGMSIAANKVPGVRAAPAPTSSRPAARAQRRQRALPSASASSARIGRRDREGVPRDAVRGRPPRAPRREDREGPRTARGGSRRRAGAVWNAVRRLARSDPEIAAAHPRGDPPPGGGARADRQRELRLPRGARGHGLGAHEQVRRGLPGQALLRRLRGRGPGRAARHRPREAALRRRARERAAALRRAGQHGGVPRAR